MVLILWGLACAWHGATATHSLPGPRDADLFGAVVNRMRAGGSYYAVMGEELRSLGYPTKPAFTWRLPTLSELEAALPSRAASVALVSGIGILATVLWYWQWRPRVDLGSLVALPILATAWPAWAWLSPKQVTLHDLWAGQLISLALALWACAWPWAALAAGAAALSIRELVWPFVVLMGAAALVEGRRREGLSWLGLAALFLGALAWHAEHTTRFLQPADYANSWVAGGGWCFVLTTARANAALLLTPGWVVATVVPILIMFLWTWRTPAGRRVAATVTLYLAAFTIVGQPFNWYWGLLLAPLMPLGLAAWALRRRPRTKTIPA